MSYTAAVYRLYYGEDFILDSIESVLPVVDQVFVCWTDRPLAGLDGPIEYQGQKHPIPYPIDYAVEKCHAIASRDSRVKMIFDHVDSNVSQFTHLVNDIIVPDFGRPDVVIIPEHDHVWRLDSLMTALDEFLAREDVACATSRQIELWRTPRYRIPERQRTGTVFWDLDLARKLPPTGRQAEVRGMHRLQAEVHNVGFCMSERNMLWKHLLAIGFSKKIGDSPPDPAWYDRWRTWTPMKGNRNLEIARGYAHLISHAEPYPEDELPEIILRRLDRWPSYEAVSK